MIALALAGSAVAFALSASAGLGGSLLLVPILSLLLGPKQGIALAALLLGLNNVAKTAVYRATIPWRAAALVLVLTAAGATLGARLLIAAPERLVSWAIIVVIASSFFTERLGLKCVRRSAPPLLAFVAGATSGFSGTSGPLKGLALRGLASDRLHFLGAASVVSLTADAVKVVIFARAALLDLTSATIVLGALPLMPLAALAGRGLNGLMGERAYAYLFWTVMTLYSGRLLLYAAIP